ncbi:MAG: hypothetical protein ACM3JD_07205 [Rudaea sp.]
MSDESSITEQEEKKPKMMRRGGGGGDAVYGIGLFGAWVYYIGRATTTEERIKGFFKGLVWPAFLVHDLLVFLGNK